MIIMAVFYKLLPPWVMWSDLKFSVQRLFTAFAWTHVSIVHVADLTELRAREVCDPRGKNKTI